MRRRKWKCPRCGGNDLEGLMNQVFKYGLCLDGVWDVLHCYKVGNKDTITCKTCGYKWKSRIDPIEPVSNYERTRP